MRNLNVFGTVGLRQPRRLSSDEIELICFRCDLDLLHCCSDRERAESEGVWLLLLLALETGLSLRELFMLQWQQIDFSARSVRAIDHLAATVRDVPLSAEAIDTVRAPWPHLTEYPTGPFVLPFWSGNLSPYNVRRVECHLNRRLESIFEDLDLTYADIVFSSTALTEK
jgi:integrase